ncbi:MAG TPA: hypothetical protein VGM97_07980 [Steroidobacteraceae bacterium]
MLSFTRVLVLASMLLLAIDANAASPLGINLAAVAYYSPEQPFLNILKSGGTSSAVSNTMGWYTATGNSWDTQEESYLQLDADGYPTSLTGSAPHARQQFTFVRTALNFHLPKLAPGQSAVYPPGRYRMKFEGQGTLRVAGDARRVAGDTCGADLSLSNKRANTYVSCTFTVDNPGGNEGLLLEITAITNSADHPRDISVVQNAFASDFDAGAIFNPTFIAALTGFSSVRFMEWMKTNNEFTGYPNTASIPSGATGLTLASAWLNPSGSYPIIFIDGERRTANFTHGSASVSWSEALSHPISKSGNAWQWGSQTYYSSFYLINKTWASRSKPSNAFWDLQDGVPLEVIVALCNQLRANCHINVPLTYSDGDIAAMAQLVLLGTNMQGGPAGGLAAPLTASFELSNEVWNGSFDQYDVAASLGGATWPSSTPSGANYAWNRNYLGMRTAQMAKDLQTAVGAALFARVIPVLGAQAATTNSATYALQTSYWPGGPAANYPIKAIAIAPYWGNNLSLSDCTAMTGQKDGGLADFFATLTSQTGAAGHTYASVPAGGFLGQAEGWIKSYTGMMSAYPSMKLIAYEAGQSFSPTTAGTCAGWSKLVTAAERDARMGAAYTRYLAYWRANVGDTAANIDNLFNDVFPLSAYGAWGLLESVMQSVNPLSSSPPKYQATIDYLRH